MLAVRIVSFALTFTAILYAQIASLSVEIAERPQLTLHGVHTGLRLQLMDGVHPLGIVTADHQEEAHFAIDRLPSGRHAVRAVEWGTGRSIAGPVLFTIPAQPADSLTAGVAYATGLHAAVVASGDLDGDGLPDLVLGATGTTGESSVQLMRNQRGAFSAPVKLAAIPPPVAIAVEDFDGDGRNDLAIATSDGRVAILLNRGGGQFSSVRYFAAGTQPSAMVSADFNGDGIPDLALADQQNNTVSILLGNGDGSFQPAIVSPSGYSPRALVVADFNGDGLADLATANFQGNDVSILLGDGKGSFLSAGNVAAGNGPVSLAVADFDEDGTPDLVVLNQFDGAAVVLMNSGSAMFRRGASIPDASSLAVGDMNGDGHADLVVQSGAAVDVRPGRGNPVVLARKLCGCCGGITAAADAQGISMATGVRISARSILVVRSPSLPVRHCRLFTSILWRRALRYRIPSPSRDGPSTI